MRRTGSGLLAALVLAISAALLLGIPILECSRCHGIRVGWDSDGGQVVRVRICAMCGNEGRVPLVRTITFSLNPSEDTWITYDHRRASFREDIVGRSQD